MPSILTPHVLSFFLFPLNISTLAPHVVLSVLTTRWHFDETCVRLRELLGWVSHTSNELLKGGNLIIYNHIYIITHAHKSHTHTDTQWRRTRSAAAYWFFVSINAPFSFLIIFFESGTALTWRKNKEKWETHSPILAEFNSSNARSDRLLSFSQNIYRNETVFFSYGRKGSLNKRNRMLLLEKEEKEEDFSFGWWWWRGKEGGRGDLRVV